MHESASSRTESIAVELRVLLECAPDAALVVNGDAVVLDANRQALRLAGLEEPELGTVTLGQIISLGAFEECERNTWSAGRLRRAGEVPVNVWVTGMRLGDAGEVRLVYLRPIGEPSFREGETAESMNCELSVRLAREESLAMVAHDLRSPLGAITVSTELLLDFDVPDETRRYHLEVIQRASARMSRLIQELLDVARIESGNLDLQLTAHPLPALLEEACELYRTRARSRSIALTWSADAGLPELIADRDRMFQALSNIIDNGIRYTRDGGRVLVVAERCGDDAVFSVRDEGPGIPAQELDRVFDRYWQPRRRGGGAAGLGLAIAKGIIERHGGRIWIESTSEEGSCFRFTIPLVAAARQPAA